MVLKKLDIHMQRNKAVSYFTLYRNNNKMNKDLNARANTIKFLEWNRGINLCDLRFIQQYFLWWNIKGTSNKKPPKLITWTTWKSKTFVQQMIASRKWKEALVSVAKLFGHFPGNQRVTGSIPGQEGGREFSPPLGRVWEATDWRFFLSLSPSLPSL